MSHPKALELLDHLISKIETSVTLGENKPVEVKV